MFSGDWDRATTSEGDWLVPEMLSFSVGLCLLLGAGRNVWIPGTFVAFYGYDEIRFERRLLVGDTISSQVTVDDLVPKGERGLVVYTHETFDQHKRLVCSSRHRVLLARRPGATEVPA
jgi:acyl dehydratase